MTDSLSVVRGGNVSIWRVTWFYHRATWRFCRTLQYINRVIEKINWLEECLATLWKPHQASYFVPLINPTTFSELVNIKASRPHECTGSNAALGKYSSCKNEDIGSTCVTDPQWSSTNSENADRKFPLEVVRDWDELYAEYNEQEDEQGRACTGSTTAIESQRVRWRKRTKRSTRGRHSLSYDMFLEAFPFREIHSCGRAVRSITPVLGHTCEPLQRLFTPSLSRVRYNRESEFLGIIYRCERDCEKIGWSVLE